MKVLSYVQILMYGVCVGVGGGGGGGEGGVCAPHHTNVCKISRL